MKYKILSFAMAAITALSSLTSMTAMAEEPYQGYTYNSYGERVPAPNAYLPQKVITGDDLGVGQMTRPTDIFVDENDDVYVVDSGNGRVLILDKSFKLKKVLDTFVKNGQPSPLKDPDGIFAKPSTGKIYIADKGNSRVAICDYDGNIIEEIFKPETDLLDDAIVFSPKKVVVNSIDNVFILSENINQGLVTIDEKGKFQKFFGAEKIQLTIAQTIDLQWRSILSREQIAQTATFQPTEYANIFIDNEDFIYTATALETYEKAQIKRLNPTGTNIMDGEIRYGDLTGELEWNVMKVSAIIDVTVDDDGFIYALDRNFGRIYMYDEQSWNLAIFGKKDTTFGTFSEPVAIENVDGKIIVLDATKSNITVFEPTEYGKKIIEAENFHYKGRYEQALAPWVKVHDMNNNYEWAYAGIGRSQHMEEEYKSAMENFRLANNPLLYSKSKKKQRTIVMRKHFTSITLGSLALILALYYGIKYRKKIAEFIKEKKEGGKK